jgi:hypothetical protein
VSKHLSSSLGDDLDWIFERPVPSGTGVQHGLSVWEGQRQPMPLVEALLERLVLLAELLGLLILLGRKSRVLGWSDGADPPSPELQQ